MSHWKINVLGELSAVATDGRQARLPRCVWSLITFLLTTRGQSALRAEAAAALWPDVDESAARNRLATALWRAKLAFAPDESPIVATSGRLAICVKHLSSIDALVLDLRLKRTLTSLETGPIRQAQRKLWRALASYGGDFAPGIDEYWILPERERLRTLQLDGLFQLASSLSSNDDWCNAVIVARKLCDADPLREDAHRLLMTALEKTGNRALAARQYHKCRCVLDQELGIAPMDETAELYRSLVQIRPIVAPERPSAVSEDLKAAVTNACESLNEILRILERSDEAVMFG